MTMLRALNKIIAITTFLLLGLLPMQAFDLPVKTINGKPYYYYQVKQGDTVYSLMKQFGVTRAQLLASNPSAADRVRPGDVLYFEAEPAAIAKADPTVNKANSQPVSGDEQPSIHHVKKGETLYGLSRKFGVSVEELVAANPGAANGVKAGSVIIIPSKPIAEPQPVAEPQPAIVPQPIVEPVVEPQPIVEDDDDEDEAVTGQIVEETEVVTIENDTTAVAEGNATIAVLLPLMLEEEVQTRQTQLFTDFYRGLLIAADTLSHNGNNVKIAVYDTRGDLATVNNLMAMEQVAGASVIIAPDNAEQIAAISNAAAGDAKVLNVFNVKDSLYLTLPNLVQANAPHTAMYQEAMRAIRQLFQGYVPVILRNETGYKDKQAFVDYMTECYRNEFALEPIVITYDGALLSSQVEFLNEDPETKYLIVPSSGSLQEFNRFSHVLKSLRDGQSDPARIAVLGYPDWVAFRSDSKELLHKLNATVYSRYDYNSDGFDARCLNEAFVRWFGAPMIDVVPNQAMMGFDVGRMLIRNLRANNGNYVPTDVDGFYGVQSAFGFTPVEGGGYVNDDIFILKYEPSGTIKRVVIEK